jgi:hypothetical protein
LRRLGGDTSTELRDEENKGFRAILNSVIS